MSLLHSVVMAASIEIALVGLVFTVVSLRWIREAKTDVSMVVSVVAALLCVALFLTGLACTIYFHEHRNVV